jgi:hypothetical protein
MRPDKTMESEITIHELNSEAGRPEGNLLESVLHLTRQILDCVRTERYQDAGELFAKRLSLIAELKEDGVRRSAGETPERRETIRNLMDANHSITRELETRKKRISDKLRVLRQKKMLERYSH